MKKRPKFLVLALAGLLTAAPLTACSFVFEPAAPSPFTTAERSTLFASLPSVGTLPPLDPESTLTATEPTDPSAEPSGTTTRAPATTEPPAPEYPTFDNLVELGDYLAECRKEGELEPIFRYTGDHDEVWDQNYADMLCLLYTWINYYGGERDLYQLEMLEYPGDRMLDAYRSGDRSALSDEEDEALDIAVSVVADAKESSGSELELEVLLHDWICDNAAYSRAAIYVPDPSEPPHHLTAIGALLDGSVNCQGYSDAFYLLASMAGFTVDRQFAMTAAGAHVFNTILLDGEWYIVDVCHDDTSLDGGGSGIYDYRYLNAGRDRCAHAWEEAYELHPISAESGDGYYYNYYDLTFDEVDDAARAIVEGWTEDGQSEFTLMLEGRNAGWEELNPVLSGYLDRTGRAYKFTTWHSFQGDNTYYYVVFE